MTTTARPARAAIDESKLNAFIGKILGDIGAVTSAVNIIIGDRLGIVSGAARGGTANRGATR